MFLYILIPLIPLAASITLALSGRRLSGQGHRIVIPAVAASFVLSVAAFFDVVGGGAVRVPLYRFLESGDLVVDLALFIDQLTVLLLLLVTGVSAVVQVYSARYMIGDSRHSRFFALTSLFTSAMILLVMSSNLLLTYIFWEVMGLCSYLLISHYAQRRSAYRAATKVFLVNAVADVGLGLGVILTFRAFGTLDIPQILANVDRVAGETVQLAPWLGIDASVSLVTLITLFLFVGAMGKSAQVPLHVWLPLAMEAPTPVSALIHAATMVNAGPFLLVRLSPLIALSPTAMTVIACVGGLTAVFAALVALPQSDVKRTLAYSTISQLGFMTLLCGLGAFAAAIFHLLAHGFFKAFLFLSTGNVLAATHPRRHEEHQPTGGGAMKALGMGALLLSVFPPIVLFSGPYEDLWRGQGFTAAGLGFWLVGLGTVFFTSIYLFRAATTLFTEAPPSGRVGPRTDAGQPRLFSGRHVLGVALGAVVASTVVLAAWRLVGDFLSPVVGRATLADPSVTTPTGWSVWIVIPLAVALAGWATASFLHQRASANTRGTSQAMRGLYVFFLNKGYVDEIYDRLIVHPSLSLSRWLWHHVDVGGIDRLVLSIGSFTVGFSRWLWQLVDVRGIMGGMERLAGFVGVGGRFFQRIEPRTVQQNLISIMLWLTAALVVFYAIT